MADGCRHVYIDMGTNIGHNIRKVYQPELYKRIGRNAITEELFSRNFGDERRSVCSFGFEANPIHEPRLKRLETACQKFGYRVHIFTSTAVYDQYTNVSLNPDLDPQHNSWAARLIRDNFTRPGRAVVIVPAVDMADFMLKEVIGRYIPPGESERPPSVVMKTDIEWTDVRVMSHLILQGVFCHIDEIYGEHLSKAFLAAIKVIMAEVKSCKPAVIHDRDDESGDDCLPHPGESTYDPDSHWKCHNQTGPPAPAPKHH
eukprot:gene4461-14614_t